MTAEDSDKGTFELTRRRALGGLATIGAASALAGAGTMAWFSDTEESANNSVTAGTLNLEPAGSSEGGSFNISANGLAPGEEMRVGFLDLKNVGNVGGTLSYDITDITNNENGRNDAEMEAGDGSANTGELGQFLRIRAFVDRTPGNNTINAHDNLTSDAASGTYVDLSQGAVDTDVSVDPNEEVRIWVYVYFDPGTNDNRAQSDEALVDVDFTLKQTQP